MYVENLAKNFVTTESAKFNKSVRALCLVLGTNMKYDHDIVFTVVLFLISINRRNQINERRYLGNMLV